MKAATVFRCEHDINQLVTCHNIKTGFLQGDSNAHRFEIEVVDDMNPVDLSGKTVICDVLIDSPQSPQLVPVPGTISGNLVTVILPGACYAIPARINIAVRLVDGEDSQNRVTILWASAIVVKSKTSTVIDPGNVVPDLTTLLAQIDRMKQATADAEEVVQNVDGLISAAVDPVAADVSELRDDKLDIRTAGNWVDVQPVVENGLISATSSSVYDNKSYNHTIIDVAAGEQYKISGFSVNASYAGIVVTAGTTFRRVVSGTSAAFIDVVVDIQPGETRMKINGGVNTNVIKVLKYETERQTSEQFWEEYQELAENVSGLDNRVSGLDNRVSGLDNRVSGLDNRVSGLDNRVSGLESGEKTFVCGVNHLASGTIDVFVKRYDSTHDMRVGIKPKASNNLPDLYAWGAVENHSDVVLNDKTGAAYRAISQGDTDYLSPSTVYAVNNIDGDFPSFTKGALTGGWHGYNSATSGGSATARNISCKVYCDGEEIPVGSKARGNRIVVDIVNRLQGSNTEKADGSGREIVEQHFRISFGDGHRVIVDGEITALEDILYATYYGVSYYFYSTQRTVPCYLVGDEVTRAGVLPSVSLHRSDDKCNGIRTINDTDVVEMGIDQSVDLGAFRHNRGWNIQISSLKAYPMLVSQSDKDKYLPIPQGGKAFWRGYYDCRVVG